MGARREQAVRLLQTTAVRLALKYTVLYALVLGLALLALAWTTRHSLDDDLTAGLRREAATLRRVYSDGGAERLIGVLARSTADAADGRFNLLVGPDGTKLAGNLLRWPEDIDLQDSAAEPQGSVRIGLIDEAALPPGQVEDDVYWPVLVERLGDGNRLLLARQVDQAHELQEAVGYLTEFFLAALLLALAMGVALGRAMLHRMDRIGGTAVEIMAGDLSRRVPLSGRRDEFDHLADQLNRMLDRIEQLIQGLRHTTDNVAHDLRSPLTRLRNQLEVTLLESRGEDDYRQAIGRGIEELEALIRVFNALLEIAQAEAGTQRSQWEPVELDRLAADIVDLYQPVAEDNGQTLKLLDCAPATILGSRHLLAQAVSNLLENALKYTPAGGAITLRLRRNDGDMELSVADTGPGIPSAQRRRVLERFVRLDNARHTPGNGLGLSLVQAVARLHQAEFQLDDAGPGLRATLRFAGTRS